VVLAAVQVDHLVDGAVLALAEQLLDAPLALQDVAAVQAQLLVGGALDAGRGALRAVAA